MPTVNLSVYICPSLNIPGWDQTSAENTLTAMMFCVPKECLSKPWAGIFMTVFNSVSVQFWFHCQLKWCTISGKGSIKPSACFIPSFSCTVSAYLTPRKHIHLHIKWDTIFPVFFKEFTLKRNEEFSCRIFEFIRFIGSSLNTYAIMSITIVGS